MNVSVHICPGGASYQVTQVTQVMFGTMPIQSSEHDILIEIETPMVQYGTDSPSGAQSRIHP